MSPGHTECWFSDQKGPETTCSASSWCPQGPGRKQGVNSKWCDLKMFKQKDERPECVGGTEGESKAIFLPRQTSSHYLPRSVSWDTQWENPKAVPESRS